MGPHQSASAVLAAAAAAAAGRGSAMAEGEKRGCQEPCCRRCRRFWRMLMAALWWRFQRRWPPHVALLQRRMPGTGRSLWWATTSSPPFLCSPRAGGGGGCVVSTARVRCGSGAAGPWQGEQVLVVAYLAGVHTTVSRCASRRRRSESVGDEGRPARMPCHEDQAPYASTASAPNVSTTRCTKRGPRTSGGDRARSTSGARDAPHSRGVVRVHALLLHREARARAGTP